MPTKKLYVVQRVANLEEVEGVPREELQRLHDQKKWPKRYDVKKVVGSVTPKIHTTLTEEDVEVYCGKDDWHVEIT